ncbi:aminoglycoside phosphotransferase family protein [Paenibacillus sp. M1]|uniref:Aminoglycoside phosphotransferase family protein n=1 Tax=Paenibacillus haidiansis TaxID=1574488 RepID=A0ABU7VNI7_9BACL
MNQGAMIGQGRTAEVYGYGEGKILKLYRPGFPLAAIREEYEASKLVCTLDLDAPQTYEMIESEHRMGIVYEYAEGQTLLNRISTKPWTVAAGARLMAELHFRMHRQQAGLKRNQHDALRQSIQSTDLLDEREKRTITVFLDSLPRADSLCHGDFHPDNILVGDRNWVIDWMNAVSGNPAADVARTVLLLSHGSMPEGIPAIQRGIVQFIRSRLRNTYIKRYFQLSKLSYPEVERWMLPVAAARLMEGVPEAEKLALVKMIRAGLDKM